MLHVGRLIITATRPEFRLNEWPLPQGNFVPLPPANTLSTPLDHAMRTLLFETARERWVGA